MKVGDLVRDIELEWIGIVLDFDDEVVKVHFIPINILELCYRSQLELL